MGARTAILPQSRTNGSFGFCRGRRRKVRDCGGDFGRRLRAAVVCRHRLDRRLEGRCFWQTGSVFGQRDGGLGRFVGFSMEGDSKLLPALRPPQPWTPTNVPGRKTVHAREQNEPALDSELQKPEIDSPMRADYCDRLLTRLCEEP
jgi:hypothetical protein